MNSYDLQGRVAVITGGAQGIGLAVAGRMVASGARVVLWDRDEDMARTSAQAMGPMAHAAAADVTDGAALIALAPDLAKTTAP